MDGEKATGSGRTMWDAISVSSGSEIDEDVGPEDVDMMEAVSDLHKSSEILTKIGQNLEKLEKDVKKSRDEVKAVHENVKDALSNPVSTINF